MLKLNAESARPVTPCGLSDGRFMPGPSSKPNRQIWNIKYEASIFSPISQKKKTNLFPKCWTMALTILAPFSEHKPSNALSHVNWVWLTRTALKTCQRALNLVRFCTSTSNSHTQKPCKTLWEHKISRVQTHGNENMHSRRTRCADPLSGENWKELSSSCCLSLYKWIPCLLKLRKQARKTLASPHSLSPNLSCSDSLAPLMFESSGGNYLTVISLNESNHVLFLRCMTDLSMLTERDPISDQTASPHTCSHTLAGLSGFQTECTNTLADQHSHILWSRA